MPSTTSSAVSSPFASSTVMTPSCPTLSIASASMSPIVASPFADTVPTCAMRSRSFTGFACVRIASTALSTAASMPRLRSIASKPAASSRSPSRKIARARTVAVVVPSPATSEVFCATSRTIRAPMFWNLPSSSISLTTVTPSLVIVGAPQLFWSITFRPRGPSVTRAASASRFTPARIPSRAFSCIRTIFAGIRYAPPLATPFVVRGRAVLSTVGTRPPGPGHPRAADVGTRRFNHRDSAVYSRT